MAASPVPILCVGGTGPGVGKTTVMVGLVRRAIDLGGHPVGMKPIEVGCRHGEDHDLVSEDGEALRAARGRPLPPLIASPYRFASSTNPLLAARRAGINLRVEHLVEAVRVAAGHGDVVFVELPSGALSPVAEDGCGLDLAARLEARLLLVATPGPGAESTIFGHLESARARGVAIGGVLLNSPPPEPSALPELETLLSERGGVTVFGSLPPLAGSLRPAVSTHLEQNRVLERAFAPEPSHRASAGA